MVLRIEELTMNFSGLCAIDHFGLQVNRGEIVALIGPNGAGKTTFFNCITGIYRPDSGTIHIHPPDRPARSINHAKPHQITAMGVARTFQNIRLFQNMTALENVMVGYDCHLSSGLFDALLHTRRHKREEQRALHESYAILQKMGIERYVNEIASNLPYGVQRRLEMARALATDPFLLLLDEPAAGMNPQETIDLVQLILRLRESEGLSILLIEHDMSLVMRLSERIYVMDYGKLIATGRPEEIRSDPAVITAYLGEES